MFCEENCAETPSTKNIDVLVSKACKEGGVLQKTSSLDVNSNKDSSKLNSKFSVTTGCSSQMCVTQLRCRASGFEKSPIQNCKVKSVEMVSEGPSPVSTEPANNSSSEFIYTLYQDIELLNEVVSLNPFWGSNENWDTKWKYICKTMRSKYRHKCDGVICQSRVIKLFSMLENSPDALAPRCTADEMIYEACLKRYYFIKKAMRLFKVSQKELNKNQSTQIMSFLIDQAPQVSNQKRELPVSYGLDIPLQLVSENKRLNIGQVVATAGSPGDVVNSMQVYCYGIGNTSTNISAQKDPNNGTLTLKFPKRTINDEQYLTNPTTECSHQYQNTKYPRNFVPGLNIYTLDPRPIQKNTTPESNRRQLLPQYKNVLSIPVASQPKRKSSSCKRTSLGNTYRTSLREHDIGRPVDKVRQKGVSTDTGYSYFPHRYSKVSRTNYAYTSINTTTDNGLFENHSNENNDCHQWHTSISETNCSSPAEQEYISRIEKENILKILDEQHKTIDRLAMTIDSLKNNINSSN